MTIIVTSAADLYIKDYLHPYVESGHREAKPLRVLYRYRWVQTVNNVVLLYSLRNTDPNALLGDNFRPPTREDLEKHRLVVATLTTSKYLYNLGVEAGKQFHFIILFFVSTLSICRYNFGQVAGKN